VNSVATYREKTERTVIKCELFRVRFVLSCRYRDSRWPPTSKNRDTYNGAARSRLWRNYAMYISRYISTNACALIYIYLYDAATIQGICKEVISKIRKFWYSNKLLLSSYYDMLITSLHKARILRTL